jgi:Flp pilus assembly protein TadD
MVKRALQLGHILQHGMTAHREGRLAEAERSYQAVLDVKRDDFDSLHLLGVMRWEQSRHGEASKLIKQALRVRPDSAEACANLGIVLRSLITIDLDAYQALALKLATDRPLLESIRCKLVQNIGTSPLLDVARTCRDIEASYAKMWEIYLRGETPRSFRVERT